MRALNILLALAVGFVCWTLVAVLSGGVAPLGRVGGEEGLLFFTPVVCYAVPVAVLAFDAGRTGSGMWLLATAPVLGALNFALVFGVSMALQTPPDHNGLAAGVLALVWIALSLLTWRLAKPSA